MIEFTNRLFSGLVVLASIAAWLLSYVRKPYRRDLMWISLALPLGVFGQAVVGGLTVNTGWRPAG